MNGNILELNDLCAKSVPPLSCVHSFLSYYSNSVAQFE